MIAQAPIYDAFFWTAERLGMARRRRRLLAETSGRVLEIGAGTGLNLDFYPESLDRLVLTEPDPAMVSRLTRRAARRPDAEVVEAGAEALPFEDVSFDYVVSTMVLCTVPDPAACVAEIERVLRPGGRLLFIEHVRADRRGLARRQDRLDPLWTKMALGCHCNRPTHALLEDSELTIERLEPAVWYGMPRLIRPLVVGNATS